MQDLIVNIETGDTDIRDFTQAEVTVHLLSLVPKVPSAITALQGLLAIDRAGLSTAYENWANSPSRTFVERAFIAKAMTWRRDDPTLLGAAVVLGLTEAQLDELFLLASTL